MNRVSSFRVWKSLAGSLVCAAAVWGSAAPVRAQSPENILLVVNESSEASRQIADYYVQKRKVPPTQIVRLKIQPADDIARAEYEVRIEAPIAAWISRNAAHDRILYLVLAKGIPLRVRGTIGRRGTMSSVDSELTLLYRKMAGFPIAPGGPVDNPYFLGDRPVAQARVFTHERQDIFLVSRLDGFTVEDVKAMIDRASAPVSDGRILLDQKAGWQEIGNEWLQKAADALVAAGFSDRMVLEPSAEVLTDEKNVLGYYSWGSNDPAISRRRLNLSFTPGALAAMFVSTDGRTFTEPPSAWTFGAWENRRSYFAGSPQSLAGDLIREGVTGTAAQVAEPFLDAAIRPDILFPAYLAGFNLIESFYLAMPYLGWQTVVIGDPLCGPFRKSSPFAHELDRGLDPMTELPVFFAERRLRSGPDLGLKLDAIRLFIRAEARTMRQDRAGARQALEEATALDDRLTQGHVILANFYEGDGEYDKAIERYRRVLARTPNDPITLNNLAYALAVRKHQPGDALPFAEKAYAQLRGHGSVADTLGWIYHLLGDETRAIRLLALAAQAAPRNFEIRLHAAEVFLALGRFDEAARELGRAIEINPGVKDLAEAKEIRARLDKAPKRRTSVRPSEVR